MLNYYFEILLQIDWGAPASCCYVQGLSILGGYEVLGDPQVTIGTMVIHEDWMI